MTASSLPQRGVVLGVAVLVIGVFVVSATPAAANDISPSHAGHMDATGAQMGGPFGSLWWMPIVMPGLWFGVVAGVVYLSYRIIPGTASTGSANEALDRAYARGEISADEYERRRERLES